MSWATDSRFDCVTFWHVLEHLDDPVEVLTRLRSLRQAGWHRAGRGTQLRFLAGPVHRGILAAPGYPQTSLPFHEAIADEDVRGRGFRVQGVSYGEIEYDVIGWSQSLLNLGFGGRNEFFKAVSGRSGGKWSLHRAIQIPAGLGLSLLATHPRLGREPGRTCGHPDPDRPIP